MEGLSQLAVSGTVWKPDKQAGKFGRAVAIAVFWDCVSNNQISKLENLEGLSQLQSLGLSGNQISKLENLEGLSQLQSLGLSGNQISKLENLEGLSQLQFLVLFGEPDKQAGKFGRAVAIAVFEFE